MTDTETLLRKLHSSKDSDRMAAAEALGESREASAIEPLCQALLRDPVLLVCNRAADALGKIGSPDAVPALLEALETQSVLIPAIRALGAIHDRSAVPKLIEMLEYRSYRSEEREFVEEPTGPIILTGILMLFSGLFSFMLRTSTGMRRVSQETGRHVRLAAAQALGQVGDPRALSPLRRLAAKSKRDTEMRNACLTAIREIEEFVQRVPPSLPLPAAAPPPDVTTLPISAGAPQTSPETLPRPAQSPTEPETPGIGSKLRHIVQRFRW